MSPLHEQDFLWTPKVKDRPRAQPGGGRSYTPKKTVTAEAAFLEQYTGPTFEQMLAVEYDFYNDHVTMRVFEHDTTPSASCVAMSTTTSSSSLTR